jgi:putative transposase
MPRPPRLFTPGALYHITARGNRKQPIFLTDNDRELFLTLLGRIFAQLNLRCHAYCLLQNHYHLVAESPDENLSAGLQRLNGRYAQAFNTRYDLTGHVFQGRFHAVVVARDGHLFELIRYIAMNPVRAGLCARPEAWPWSSYRAVAGIAPQPSFLNLELVRDYWDPATGRAAEKLRRFVGEARARRLDDLAA